MTVLNTSYPCRNLSSGEDHLDGQGFKILYALIGLTCAFGLVGNGIVTLILSIYIKRNSFTTYILNLAIADFCSVLIVLVELIISWPKPFLRETTVTFAYFAFTHNTGLYLLTLISIERCVSVFLPVWYRCHRSSYASAVQASLLWVLSGLFSGMMLLFHFLQLRNCFVNIVFAASILNTLLFTPVMMVSTFILLIKTCHNSRLHLPARAYTAIVVTLFFIIIFDTPLNMLTTIRYGLCDCCDTLDSVAPVVVLLASFNSSMNPVTYYLAGRDSKDYFRRTLKGALERLFKEEAAAEVEGTG
ncbi:Mas-related G-protein coupled receptor member H [Varanus komodoensis]|uniref:mas-related G-protein coupled receptor member H-like n=1 Tax=Varanus komodoensis TaxID=61221 RepID=UPI001CF781B8|nr:mas-related G-protein coupled receptor member H-like [Varanus komodoensis]KAF7237375.1 Mas-related G-protein coupled receptor member H [Varanus komodoensis]